MSITSSIRGLQILKGIEHYCKSKPHHFDTSMVLKKVKFISASDGCLKGTFTVDGSMCNMMDTIHGGYSATVIDVFTAFGIITSDNAKQSWTTDINIVYINPAKIGDSVLVQTKPLKVGYNSFMETLLTNETTGKPMAKGVVSLFQFGDKFVELSNKQLNLEN